MYIIGTLIDAFNKGQGKYPQINWKAGRQFHLNWRRRITIERQGNPLAARYVFRPGKPGGIIKYEV
jgi:hypothetical protein